MNLPTTAMTLAIDGIIPTEEYYHDPTIRNLDGWTVGMYLAMSDDGFVPTEWYYDGLIQDLGLVVV